MFTRLVNKASVALSIGLIQHHVRFPVYQVKYITLMGQEETSNGYWRVNNSPTIIKCILGPIK
jgi:hypothetical protein